ncbi:IS1 family transposase [Chryseobacterium luquanense]|uniref:IS1 family transposase n=1 Tax=Chryseobacterium luquanense TaxID=2983766 RepID=A0ABT3Y8H0_9FLAO|nr:IS1 family transposase [Chryseobacterium luquanense]MCX8534407.1 IS1 family transposase [Chryseobacterium luquanense]
MRIFIRRKANPIWLVYAIDKITKQVASFYVCKRNNKTLNAIVKTLISPKAEKIDTDRLRNYRYLIPNEIHNTKKYGTNGIERKKTQSENSSKKIEQKTICFSRSTVVLSSILKIYFWSCNKLLEIVNLLISMSIPQNHSSLFPSVVFHD